MPHPTFLRPLLLFGLCALGVGACVQVLGNDFVVIEEDDDGAGGTNMANSGGGGATTAGGGNGGTAGSANGGMGGVSNPGCAPMNPSACQAGDKCSVVDPVSGATDCVAAGTTTAFGVCADDNDCVGGTFCSPLRKVCKRFCELDADCGPDGVCRDLWLAAGDEIPGAKVCIARCNPVAPINQSVCPTGTTCSRGSVSGTPGLLFDCVRGGNVSDNQICSGVTATDFTRDCFYGLDCFSLGPDKRCRSWCTPIGQQANCSGNFNCTDIGGVMQLGVSYGFCN